MKIGGCPWDTANEVHFPLRLGEVKSLQLTVGYHYAVVPTGRYDLAYDMFLSVAACLDRQSAPIDLITDVNPCVFEDMDVDLLFAQQIGHEAAEVVAPALAAISR